MKRIPEIIDTHVHFFDKGDSDFELEWSWLEPGADHPILGNIDPIKSIRFDLDALDAESRFAGVSGFVHVQAAIGSKDPVDETKWLDQMATASLAPVQIIGHVDLATNQAPDQLARHLEASSRFVGVRDFSVESALSSGDISAFSEAFGIMTREELILELDCEYPNMAAAREMAEENPELTIVLEHIGFPRRRDADYFRNWSNALTDLSQASNVLCKISGLGMTDPRFDAHSLAAWINQCLESFGSDRLLLGSNWPIDRLYSSYDAIMNIYRDSFSELSAVEQELIFNKTAARIYRF